MLTSLSIKNFALIDDINIHLDDGFSIITGETGAGKSIVLGALSLLLGKRADVSTVRDSTKKCAIEGIFEIGKYNLKSVFIAEELDYEPQTIIRREILPSGKSRAFVNDTPVKLSSLQVLGEYLVDVHSQNESLSLGSVDYQFFVVDTFAGLTDLRASYRKKLEELKAVNKTLVSLKADQAEAAKVLDYNLFLLDELEKAELKEGMQESLEERQEQLSNVEVLKDNLGATINLLQDEPVGILEMLAEAKRHMGNITTISSEFKALYERINSNFIDLEDVSAALEQQIDNVEDNPEALEETNAKLQLLYNLQKKHQAESVTELLQIEERLAEAVTKTQNADDEIEALSKAITKKKAALKIEADNLNDKRHKAIPKLKEKLQGQLSQLGMPNARFEIELLPVEKFTTYGSHELKWLLSANKGGNFSEIKKAASGGELSRIMLSVKSVLANKSKLPTIIFDEIDTGVSGDIANRMAEIMAKMGKSLQVISITHLPQIASKGQHHYKVYKTTDANKTKTQIKKLETNERIVELAEMLGGKQDDDAVMTLAKSLLN